MIGKLLKYELRATARTMLPLYLVMFAATILTAVDVSTNLSRNIIIDTIINAIFFIAVFVVIVVSFLLILQRYYKNLLGSEGYLMFTLPVTTQQNIFSKALTALIWIVCSISVGAGCGLLFIHITGDVSEFRRQLRFVWQTWSDNGNPHVFLFLLITLVTVGALARIIQVYAAISVGHQWSNHRILGSLIAYMVFAVIEGLIYYLIVNSSAWARELMRGDTLFNRNLLITGIVFSGIEIAIYGFIAWYLLDRHLNLE